MPPHSESHRRGGRTLTVITHVTIKDLRGVAQGQVSGFTPLTILTGVNGSGKSTVLDALLIGASQFPAMAIGQAVKRRASKQFTGEWLFRRKSVEASVSVQLDGTIKDVPLQWLDAHQAEAEANDPDQNPLGAIRSLVNSRFLGGGPESLTFFEADGAYWSRRDSDESFPKASPVRLIDMRGFIGDQREMTEVLTDAKSAGFGDHTIKLLLAVVPGLKNLEILKVGSGYEVGLIFDDGAVPLSMAGDGVRGLARLALELAALGNGLALIEEPEVHQHPGSLKQSASTIVAGVERGLQVVVATHSLELIDELILSSSKQDLLGKLSVQQLRLTRGQLETTVFSGQEADKIRNVIGTELR